MIRTIALPKNFPLGAVLALLLAGAAALAGQSSFTPPQIGFVLYGDRTVHPVLGIAGSFVAGDIYLPDAQAAAWCGTAGIAWTAGTLTVFDGTNVLVKQVISSDLGSFRTACAGAAPLAWPEGGAELWLWQNGQLRSLPIEPNGQVLSAAAGRLLVGREDGVWLVEFSSGFGRVRFERFLPGVPAEAWLVDDGVVYRQGTNLTLRRDDGSEVSVPLWLRTGPLRFEVMGAGWLHAADRASGIDLGISLDADGLRIYQLPGLSQ